MGEARDARPRLAEAMNTRRVDLGLTWREVATASGLTVETLRSIRAGDNGQLRDLTKRGIEKALEWVPGSVTTILAGGDPIPTDVRPEPLPAVFAGLIRANRQLPADEWAAVETILQGVVSFAEVRINAAKRRQS